MAATLAIDSKQIIHVVEAAYGAYATEGEWFTSVGAALNRAIPSASDFSAMAYEWGYVGGEFRIVDIGPPSVLASDARWNDDVREGILALPSTLAERLHGRMQVGMLTLASGLGESVLEHPVLQDAYAGQPQDQLGVIVPEPDGRGAIFANTLSEPTKIPRRVQGVLDRMTFHIAAGRRVHVREVNDADAVFSERGRLLHAKPHVAPKRGALDEGFQRRAAARKHAREPESALEVWRGLAAARWSIVDHWDTDGKRFALAIRNPPRTHPFDALSARERRVAALAASGHRDKEIAYVLGVTIPSVVAALSRARTKLRVETRAELAAAWRTHAWEPASLPKLTHAERSIALHIVNGWSNAKIAKARRVSERTIANQIASLLEKAGVTSRAELAGRFSAADLLRT